MDETLETARERSKEILRNRHLPVAQAARRWEDWTSVTLALGLAKLGNDRDTISSIWVLWGALAKVGHINLFDELHRQSPFLPATWEVLTGIRAMDEVEVIEDRLHRHRDEPYYTAVQEELQIWLWNRVRKSVPAMQEAEAACYATMDALEASEPGLQKSASLPPDSSHESRKLDASVHPTVESTSSATFSVPDPANPNRAEEEQSAVQNVKRIRATEGPHDLIGRESTAQSESIEGLPWVGLPEKGPLLTTWNAICKCVGQKYCRQVRRWMIDENERTAGPIRREGRKVTAFTNSLKVWWSDVETRSDIAEKKEKTKQVMDADHPLELDAAGLRFKVKKPRPK